MSEKRMANTGDKILFNRNGIRIIGEVVKVREESVIVSISLKDAVKIKVETPITVVSHKNYQLIQNPPEQSSLSSF
jgi:uncharacterized protein YkvS